MFIDDPILYTENTKDLTIALSELIKRIQKSFSIQNQSTKINKPAISTYLIITLHVNRLSAPIKRYRGAEWIQKQNPYICCLQKTDLKTHSPKVRGWKDIPYNHFMKYVSHIIMLYTLNL